MGPQPAFDSARQSGARSRSAPDDSPGVDALARSRSRRAQSRDIREALGATSAGPQPAPDASPDKQEGDEIGEDGIVHRKEGANLRSDPSPDPSAIVEHLPLNTHLYVSRRVDGYCFVATRDGRFGYIVETHLKLGLPEPGARIHHIAPGDTALSISRAYYGGKAEWGADHRFFVNGLVHVNQGEGERGIHKPRAEADWDTTQVRAGYMIWIPDVRFMQTLRGQVDSGSISHDAWTAAVETVKAIGEFLLGAGAFTVGLLHGAIESVWDIFVGLKDLVVLAVDLVKWLIGVIAGDGEGLFEAFANLDLAALVAGWIDDFDRKWNADELLAKWHFRGWLIGYVIAEVVMLFFTGGVINGIKWAGKAAKLGKVAAKLPRIARISEIAKDSKLGQKFVQSLKGASGGNAAAALLRVGRWLDEPVSIWGKGPDEIAESLRGAGYVVKVENSTKGSKLSKQIRIEKTPEGGPAITNIQVHPGGGRHGSSYYKISTSDRGKIWVVDGNFKADPGMKGTIVHVDASPSGWLLQAIIANGGVQRLNREEEP